MKAINNCNIIFWGTPHLTIHYLNALISAGYNIKAVVTQEDKPVGRKQILTSPPVKQWAQERGIIVLQPHKLDESFKETLISLEADISIVVAYGKIIPENIINLPTFGTLNVHYSLLPRWRGATPVESAILSGDQETGVSIQKMVFALDAGDILAEEKISLSEQDFAYAIKEKLSEIGSRLLIETLAHYINHTITPVIQDEKKVTRAGLIKKQNGAISLSEKGETLWRKWRAYTPWPGLFFFDQEGKRIKITDAEYIEGKFVIKQVIPEGKKEISWEQYKK